jgi:hypothetical protein
LPSLPYLLLKRKRSGGASRGVLVNLFECVCGIRFDVLIKEDEHLPRIARMDGLTDLEDTLKADLNGVVEVLREEMTKRCGDIDADQGEFDERLELVYSSAQSESVALVKGLKRSRKHLFTKDLGCTLPPRIDFVAESVDMPHVDKRVRAFKSEISSVKGELEALETLTQSSALQLIDRFEDNFSAAMASLVELLAEFFQRAMNFANTFDDALKDLAVMAIADYTEEQGDALPPVVADAGPEETEEGPPADEYLVLLGNVESMMEVTKLILPNTAFSHAPNLHQRPLSSATARLDPCVPSS